MSSGAREPVPERPATRSLKAMLRARDYDAARTFYVDVLGLSVVEAWDQPGDKGCIVAFGDGGGGGFLEILAPSPDNPKHRPAFDLPVASDKIELQIHVDDVDAWAARLAGVVQTEGPVTRPWGNRYLWLRDPDGVRIALFQGPAQ
jgi:catechol 2,3-dioxygenase-like lactoylglutathione lyase family enzyme